MEKFAKGKLQNGSLSMNNSVVTVQTTRKNLAAKKDFKLGHRGRLRARFARAGRNGVNNYELVELLLFNVLPRCDTKPLARLLLERFKTIGSMLNASEDQLKEVNGVGDAVIHIFHLIDALMKHTLEEELEERILVSDDKILRSYCQQLLAHEDIESLWGLFVDGSLGLIKSECLQKGTINKTPVFPKEIVKRALKLSASGIILLHNHPSGDVTPSDSDVKITRKIGSMAKSLDIILHDHIIVSHAGFNSLRSLGLYRLNS